MGISHKELPIHGAQFHPESIATEAGHELLANFIELAIGQAVSSYGDGTRAGEMVAL